MTHCPLKHPEFEIEKTYRTKHGEVQVIGLISDREAVGVRSDLGDQVDMGDVRKENDHLTFQKRRPDEIPYYWYLEKPSGVWVEVRDQANENV